jgi:hypothetical protein
LTINKLKGIEMPNKKGELKVNKSYYRPDANLIRHFGKFFEEIIAREAAKETRNGPLPTMEMMPLSSIMSLGSKVADKKRNSSQKVLFSNAEVVDIVQTDADLIHSLYEPHQTKK